MRCRQVDAYNVWWLIGVDDGDGREWAVTVVPSDWQVVISSSMITSMALAAMVSHIDNQFSPVSPYH